MGYDWDWREHYETHDNGGDQVVDVYRHEGEAIGYAYQAKISGNVYCCSSPLGLVPLKPKPKYRPYKRHEISCGDVFRMKNIEQESMVIAFNDQGVYLGHATQMISYASLLDGYTRVGGEPAGVLDTGCVPF